jgi:hypothetical protein
MSASLIRAFGQTITVSRDTNVEAHVKGKRVDDIFTTFDIIASVQPAKPDEIIQGIGESAERNTQMLKVYSFEELKTVEIDAQLKADRISYLGEEFEVVQVDKQIDNRMNLVHYKSMAVKVNIERFKS